MRFFTASLSCFIIAAFTFAPLSVAMEANPAIAEDDVANEDTAQVETASLPSIDRDPAAAAADDEAAPTPAEKSPRVLHAASLLAKVQVLGMRYAKGETQAMNQYRRLMMMQAIDERLDDATVKFHTKVRNVTWRDGIARISTEPDFAPPQQLTNRRVKMSKIAVQLTRRQPIEVLMDQESAARITPSSLVFFRGKVDFHPADSQTPRPRDVQEVYTVQHSELGGGDIGTFVSNDYTCTIGGTAYAGRWSGESTP